jgi:hypothetical protein
VHEIEDDLESEKTMIGEADCWLGSKVRDEQEYECWRYLRTGLVGCCDPTRPDQDKIGILGDMSTVFWNKCGMGDASDGEGWELRELREFLIWKIQAVMKQKE